MISSSSCRPLSLLCSALLSADGQLFVSLRLIPKYLAWGLESIAMKAGFQLAAAYRLDFDRFPGYCHTLADSGRVSHFNKEPARSQLCTFSFRRRHGVQPLQLLAPPGLASTP